MSVRVLSEEETAAYASEEGPMVLFEVVAVERGRGLWVREVGAPGCAKVARIPGGGAVFMEDEDCARLFDEGNMFTGRWKDGRAHLPEVMKASLLAAVGAQEKGGSGPH